MPSIGALENTAITDSNLKQVSSIISEELSGQKQVASTSNATGVILGLACTNKDTIDKTETTMAPNKTEEVEGQCKTPLQIQTETSGSKVKITSEAAPSGKQESSQAAGTDTDRAVNQCEVVPLKDDVGEVTTTKNRDDDGGGGADDGETEEVVVELKSAEKKRQEYKTKPKASSVEILGLSKQYAKIENQGFLREEIQKHFYESEMKRRKSSPPNLVAVERFRNREEGPKEDGEIERLVTKMQKVNVEDAQGPKVTQMIEDKSTSNDLTARGPMRQLQQQTRRAPYQTTPSPPQRVMPYQHPGHIYQPVLSQQYLPNPVVQTIRPSGKKVAVPGMRSHQNISTPIFDMLSDLPVNQNMNISATHQLDNMQRIQVSTRVPVENNYNWPMSPTADPISPQSVASSDSMSPEHMMQTAASPLAVSPGLPLLSPQSVMSPDSGQTMSTSPNSPYSAIHSPSSVRSDHSEDSGISSPRPKNQYTAFTSTNSGTVTVNEPFPFQPQPQIIPTVQNVSHQQSIQSIQSIVQDLMQSANEFEEGKNILQHTCRNNLNYHQGPSPQIQLYQPAVCPQRIDPQPIPVPQMIQPQIQTRVNVQNQPRSMENIVNSMSMEVLCAQDEDEDTALHIAISQGNENLCYAIINRLISFERRDAVNTKDKLGQTPLYIAVVTNQPNLVFYLVLKGADVMIANKERSTPLHYAATKGYAHALMAIGCGLMQGNPIKYNINIENKNGMSPLQCAIQAHGRYEQVYDGNSCRYVNKLVDSLDTVKNLLNMYADPAFQDSRSGYTALHFAVELPPNVNVTSNTHIIDIILKGSNDAQKLLAMKTYSGNTPLHLIAGRSFNEDYIISIIDLLISYGAEIMVQNGEKIYPHDLVSKEKRKKVYARLQGSHLQGK